MRREVTTNNSRITVTEKSSAASRAGKNDSTGCAGRPTYVYYMVRGYWG